MTISYGFNYERYKKKQKTKQKQKLGADYNAQETLFYSSFENGCECLY